MIRLSRLSVRLGQFSLKEMDLEVAEGEYVVILGPTGAGKTVLLEAIAGLHRLRHGEIWIDGENVTKLPPERRRIGYVPQDYALFPFLSVMKNITFGVAGNDLTAKKRVDLLIGLLGLAHLLGRGVKNLSGGEKQRVALARALVTSPRLLLLDEPMGSLDVRTSKYLRLELRRLHDELNITTIHVTHNLIEAEEMADRIALINAGGLEQLDTPQEILFHPRTEAVADFLGTPNILACDAVMDLGRGLVEAVCGDISVILPHRTKDIRKIALFPQDIYVSRTKPPGPDLNRFRGVVREIAPHASVVRLSVAVGNQRLRAELPREIFEEMEIVEGQEVFLILKLRSLKVY
jgi:ABC-type Fe3+/spermidine/putrescine transport system ATPase subunit